MVIFGLVLIGAGAAWIGREPLPQHAGKDVYYWMFQTKSSDLKENPGLSAIGTNALPFLAEALRVRKTAFDRFGWVRQQGVQSILTNWGRGFTWTHSAEAVQQAAALAFLAYATDVEAVRARDTLHEAVKDPHLDDSARRNVIYSLGEIGPLPESLPHLVAAWHITTNGTSMCRRELVLMLSRIPGQPPKECRDIFLTEINSPDEEIQNVAIWGVGALGFDGHSAVPAVTAMLQGTNSYSQFAASLALGRITNRIPALIHRLSELTRGTNSQAAAGAAVTLYRWGEPLENSIKILTNLLTDIKAKGIAAENLGRIGPTALSALPALISASQRDIGTWVDRYDRARCALAVLEISGDNEVAIRELKQALVFQSNSWVRYAVARDLGKTPQIGKWLEDALENNLNDPDSNARHAAASALKQIRVTKAD